MTAYRHLVLSPHYDDAVLSMGGSIARWTAAGEPVLVITVCTAIPAPDTDFSPFAEQNHRSWGLSPADAYAVRKQEDDDALAVIGADGVGLGFLDAIYRLPEAYESNDTLFGAVVPSDTLAVDLQTPLGNLLALSPDATVYAPLGIGYHVDHQQTFAAARVLERNGGTVWYYEDIPYVFEEGARDRRLSELSQTEADLHPVLSQASIVETLNLKIEAIARYASQLENLFGGEISMRTVMAGKTLGMSDGTPSEGFCIGSGAS